MRKKAKQKKTWQEEEEEEFVKSAAWAWYLHGSVRSCKFIEESDVHDSVKRRARGGGAGPSRFKLEAMGLINNNSLQQSKHSLLKRGLTSDSIDGLGSIFWDKKDLLIESSIHQSSLLDPYEIETLSRQLQNTFFGATLPAEKSEVHNNRKSRIENGVSGADGLHGCDYKNERSKSPYEIEALSKQLQNIFFGATLPAEKSKVHNNRKSRMENGVSNVDSLHDSNSKNECSKSPRVKPHSHVKSRRVPIMCSLTDVVIPGPATPTRTRNHNHSSK